MEVDEKIGGMIQKGTSPHEIRTVLRKNGSKSLREQARDMTIDHKGLEFRSEKTGEREFTAWVRAAAGGTAAAALAGQGTGEPGEAAGQGAGEPGAAEGQGAGRSGTAASQVAGEPGAAAAQASGRSDGCLAPACCPPAADGGIVAVIDPGRFPHLNFRASIHFSRPPLASGGASWYDNNTSAEVLSARCF